MSGLRIGGIATGMDLEGIVKDLMKIEQLKVDRLEQQKTLAQWQQEAYQDINRKFANFILDAQKAFGLTKAGSGGFIKQSVTGLDWVQGATVGDQSILAVSARADAVAGTHTVNVTQLASNWSAASGSKITGAEDGMIALGDGEAIDFTINGHQFTTKTVDELGLEGIENYSHISVSPEGSIKLSDVAKAINQANIGVTANYDSNIGRFFLQTTETGNESSIVMQDNSSLDGGFIVGENSLLNLASDDGPLVANEEGLYAGAGKNAVVDFGAAKGIEFQSNQFTLNNIHFSVKAKGETTVTVGTDVDGVFDKILDFVAQYNDLIETANNLLGEKKNRSFLPLTELQKQAMSEKEIETWEQKAKSGLLSRDMYLSQTVQQVRSGLYQEVQGASGTYLISNFGITTERYVAGSMGGKLEIDETKLKQAIKDDVNSVLELLFSQAHSEEAKTDTKQQRAETGLVSRIFADLTEGMKSMINKAGPGEDATLYRNVDSRMLLDFVVEQGSISFLQKDISKIDSRIFDFQAQMIRKENMYWNQFTAMEKAINQLNAQGAWLAQQFGGM